MAAAPPRSAATFMRTPLGEVSTWHLVCKCGQCRDLSRTLPIARLVAAYGPERSVGDVVDRLRCSSKACGLPPARVRAVSCENLMAPECVEFVLVGRNEGAGTHRSRAKGSGALPVDMAHEHREFAVNRRIAEQEAIGARRGR